MIGQAERPDMNADKSFCVNKFLHDAMRQHGNNSMNFI